MRASVKFDAEMELIAGKEVGLTIDGDESCHSAVKGEKLDDTYLSYSQLFIITAPSDLPRLSSLTAVGILALGLIGADDRGLCLQIEPGREVRIRSMPPLCVGLVAVSQVGFDHLRAHTDALRELASFREFTPRLLAHVPDESDLLLATNLIRIASEQGAIAASLARELTQLRTLHEEMANAFAELENKAASAGLKPISLAFENLPGRAGRAGGPGVESLSQILPVSVAGLSAIELFVEDLAQTERLYVKLATIEDAVEHCRWDLNRADLKLGWLVLQLPRGVVGSPRTALLELHTENRAAGLPIVSLGAPLAHAAYRVRCPDLSSDLKGGLALRVWTGVQGVKPPDLQSSIPPHLAHAGPRVYEMAVPFPVLRRLELAPGPWTPGFDILELRPDSSAFLLHPGPEGEITLACLDALNLTEPSRLSAEGNVESPHAKPIEFALAFSSFADADVRKLIAAYEDPVDYPEFTFSGWRRASHGEPALLSLMLTGSKGRVFFATRMADKQPEWFAWATFGKLRQTFLGYEAIAQKDMRSRAFEIAQSVECGPNSGVPTVIGLPLAALSADLEFDALIAQPDGVQTRQVEFALALTDLGALGVCARAVVGRPAFEDERFAFTGWIAPACGDKLRIGISAQRLALKQGVLYLLARLSGDAPPPPGAVHFDDVRCRSRLDAKAVA
jgi:hypothetical protein